MEHSPAYHHALEAVAAHDEATDRLVTQTQRSNMIGLTRALHAAADARKGRYANEALNLSMTSKRMWHYVKAIAATLPQKDLIGE